MTLQEKSELVRLLNLYQADLLNLNRKNIENGKTEYFVHGVKAQYEHARIISTKMVKCPFDVPTCKCYDCACNASYDECNHGYCITCFECLNESKAVHNIYLCTGYERMVANGNENSE